MTQKEILKKEPENKQNELFEQAHHDPDLKRQLLRDPRSVGDRFGVKFTDEEVQQLQKLGAISELAEEIKYGRLYPRPPIFYPINIWRIKELLDIFTHLVPGGTISYPGPGPIFYPAEPFGQNAMFSTRAYHPGWVTYPGEPGSGTGGSSGGYGGVIPGPIFYPAGLRNILQERLTQIFQIRQRLNR